MQVLHTFGFIFKHVRDICIGGLRLRSALRLSNIGKPYVIKQNVTLSVPAIGTCV